jgi:hypothetical protein
MELVSGPKVLAWLVGLCSTSNEIRKISTLILPGIEPTMSYFVLWLYNKLFFMQELSSTNLSTEMKFLHVYGNYAQRNNLKCDFSDKPQECNGPP